MQWSHIEKMLSRHSAIRASQTVTKNFVRLEDQNNLIACKGISVANFYVHPLTIIDRIQEAVFCESSW